MLFQEYLYACIQRADLDSLHGVWDADNPIGSNVLAHTNLTEIKLALDLYWRNDIPPEKLNLGIGFYGRSFQLADPSCHKPGCRFLGGADPGPVRVQIKAQRAPGERHIPGIR